MCGRMTLTTPVDQLAEQFGFLGGRNVQRQFNLAPTDEAATVRLGGDGDRSFSIMRWGLVPWWSKDTKGAARYINSRIETIVEKRAFQESYRKRRCLVLADGFYEWQKDGKKKRPFLFGRNDGRPMAFAGVWDEWRKGDAPHFSCSVLTTAPNDLLAPYHNRIPVILPEEKIDLWLKPDEQLPPELFAESFPSESMNVREVNPRVNSVRNNDAECLSDPPDEE